MPTTKSSLLIHKLLWRSVGFGSSIVGFSCYALSPSFKNLFGDWNLLKIITYSLVSFMFSGFILFANRWSLTRSSLLKANVCFMVLMVTSLYSFYQDKSEEGKAEKGYARMLSLISLGAFALTSLSLSRQIQLKFEVGMFNFFLGCIMVTVMKMNIKVALGAAAFCYVLISIRSHSDSQLENQDDTGFVIIDINNTSHQQVDVTTCLFQYDSDVDPDADSDVDSDAAASDEVFPDMVFLSYAGKDSFAQNLVDELKRRNIKIYASNEETAIGSKISFKLHSQIQRSKASVIIFSRNYADSPWRLTQLAKIMDCKRRYGQVVIPIFKGIDPSEVENQTGSYLDAFAEHESIFHKRVLQRWKVDLTEAANLPDEWTLSLHVISTFSSYFIEAIAEDIALRIELPRHKDGDAAVISTSDGQNILRQRKK